MTLCGLPGAIEEDENYESTCLPAFDRQVKELYTSNN